MTDAPTDADGVPAGPAQKTLAASVLALLQADQARYVSFGPYWPLIKALLKKFYTRDNLSLLGDSVDREAASHMPPHGSLPEALEAAIEHYRRHQAHGLGLATFEDDATGDRWTLADPDASGL